MRLLLKLLLGFWLVMLTIYLTGKIYQIAPPLAVMTPVADSMRMKQDLLYLTKACQYRQYADTQQLNKAAQYIYQQMEQTGGSVSYQSYQALNYTYKNVICSVGPEDAERIIVGAHYDVCGMQEGADDNASGVCGLLELARILPKEQLRYRIDLVAYSTEEPPFFDTENMGSCVHAKSLHQQKIKIKGMIGLEMIGLFYDEPHTQDYPFFMLEWFYGNKANFITIAHKFGDGNFSDSVATLMRKNAVIPTKSFTGPGWFGGINLSDHRNYWKFDYPAVMITNTAFYRNKAYHTKNDIAERLQPEKVALVIDELYRTILAFNVLSPLK
jgi:hypothetical protein